MSERKAVFFTGDQAMHLLYPATAMIEMLRAVNQGARIMTGAGEDGIELLVRMIGREAGLDVEVVGHTDWDTRHRGLSDDVTVVSIAVDHHTCPATVSALAVLPEDRVRLVTLVDMISG